MTETELKDTAPEPLTDTVSTRLKQAREAKGLSQKEVADELFLTTTFIRYIDEGEFRKIPKPAFIKGYLRSYSRVVGLDGDELVTAFEQEQNIAPQTPRIADVTESAEPPSGLGGSLIQTGLAGLALLVVVAMFVWWVAGDDEPAPAVSVVSSSQPAAGSAPEADPDVASAASTGNAMELAGSAGAAIEGTDEGDAAAAPTGQVADDSPAATAVADTAGDSDNVPPDVDVDEGEMATSVDTASVDEPEAAATEDMPDTDTATPVFSDATRESALIAGDAIVEDGPDVQIERVSENGTNFISVYAGGESTIEFEFSDECWVEIRDGDGAQIYADLNRSGDVMTVYGKRPFDVLLGRAPAVAMTVDGENVDLMRFTTRDETARVRTARL